MAGEPAGRVHPKLDSGPPCSVVGTQDRAVLGPEAGPRAWETVWETSRSCQVSFLFSFTKQGGHHTHTCVLGKPLPCAAAN